MYVYSAREGHGTTIGTIFCDVIRENTCEDHANVLYASTYCVHGTALHAVAYKHVNVEVSHYF